MKSTITLLGMTLLVNSSIFAQCLVDTSNIYTFNYNGATYELIRENKTWVEAANCAVSRGGKLAHIDDLAEQNAVYNEVSNNAGITASNTVAPDGGGASYVWIGGNDLASEGVWIWDGTNSGTGPQFWQGTTSGSPVGGLYNNWGNEPDNYGTSGQDGLGLAITNWPLGVAGQWNDVNELNTLYYLVEIESVTGYLEKNESDLNVFPNPFNDIITLEGINNVDVVTIVNTLGQEVRSLSIIEAQESQSIDLSDLQNGMYFITVTLRSGKIITKELMK